MRQAGCRQYTRRQQVVVISGRRNGAQNPDVARVSATKGSHLLSPRAGVPVDHSRRLMLTVGRKRCPFRCSYCFADFSQYEAAVTADQLEDRPDLLNGVEVIYPACDVDLFALRSWKRHLSKVVGFGLPMSLSTKAYVDAERSSQVRGFHDQAQAAGGLLKVGVSISTSSRIAELEPRAPSYEQRIETLANLADQEIPTALILRPLLVDVAPAEYTAIVEDAAPYTNYVLTGPEYLDRDRQHSRHFLTGAQVHSRAKVVEWAHQKPVWFNREAIPQEAAVRAAARQQGLRVFDSDMSLITQLRTESSREPHE